MMISDPPVVVLSPFVQRYRVVVVITQNKVVVVGDNIDPIFGRLKRAILGKLFFCFLPLSVLSLC